MSISFQIYGKLLCNNIYSSSVNKIYITVKKRRKIQRRFTDICRLILTIITQCTPNTLTHTLALTLGRINYFNFCGRNKNAISSNFDDFITFICHKGKNSLRISESTAIPLLDGPQTGASPLESQPISLLYLASATTEKACQYPPA